MYAFSEPYLPLFLHTINRNKGKKKEKKSIILHFKYANTPQKTLAVEQNKTFPRKIQESQPNVILCVNPDSQLYPHLMESIK